MPSIVRTSRSHRAVPAAYRRGIARVIAVLAALACLAVPATLALAQGAAGTAKPAAPASPAALQAFQQGTLAGNTGGTFDYYQIKSPGPLPLSMSLTYSPFIASQAPGVGFSA